MAIEIVECAESGLLLVVPEDSHAKRRVFPSEPATSANWAQVELCTVTEAGERANPDSTLA